MGMPAPSMGYDGVIQAGQQQIRVTDGVLQMGGRRLHVEEDGNVTDEQDKPVAVVKDGKLMPLQQQQPQQQAAA